MSASKKMLVAVGLLAVVTVTGIGLQRGRRDLYQFSEEAIGGSYEMPVPPMKEQFEQASVQIQINAASEVDGETGRCNLMAGNPSENKHDLYVVVTLDESKEIIYRSPILKSGERLAYVTLDMIPERGEHVATAEFVVLNPKTGEAIGAVDAGLLIRVK